MKKIYIITLLSFFYVQIFAQNEDKEHANLIKKELSNYAKMVDYNVNPNTLNYDLKYQRLDLSLDPAVYNVSGSVTSHFVPNQSMTSIYFDLTDQLDVTEVKYHGNSIAFSQLSSKEVKIDFPAAISASTMDSLTIVYNGAPDTTNSAFSTSSQNGIPVLYTLSEPYGAQDWFPTKQSLNDKIDQVDFKITTPSQYSVAANGKLMSESILPSGEKLTFWRTMYPTNAYLVALSITQFVKINDTMGTPAFPFVNYLYSSSNSNSTVMSNIAWTKQAMDTFETYLGPYPFRNEKYGHMEFSYPGTCMEHQTMSSMSGWGKSVIAHELAHQWFGDKITCGAWNDIWLNEGFATFGEHLVNEKLLMTNANFMNYLLSQINYITGSPGGSVYVDDANLGSIAYIFSSRLSYAKGGYLVRMIKWILGDTVFYQAVKDYHSRPNLAYGYAKSDDLKASLLQSTGKDFTEFYNDWLYGQGYPTYTIKWKQSTTNQDVTFLISQTQSHSSVSFFEMPLPIKINGTGGQVQYVTLNNTANNQYFTQAVSFPVSSIEFNYEYQILTKNATITMDNSIMSTNEVVDSEFIIYPNPAKNEIFVKGLSRITEFSIYDLSGRLIKKGKYQPNSFINISDLSPESYVLQIADKKYKFTKK